MRGKVNSTNVMLFMKPLEKCVTSFLELNCDRIVDSSINEDSYRVAVLNFDTQESYLIDVFLLFE